jgi:methyl-accepting chemotaxis protein
MKDSTSAEQSRFKGLFHRLSIQTKLVVIILASALILMGVGFSAIIYWEVKTLNRHAVEETEFAVALISQDLSRLLLVGSVDSAADTVAGLKSFDRINVAVLFDLQNQPVFYYSRNNAMDFDPKKIRPGELPAAQSTGFDLFVPVRYRNDQYGQIYLNVSSGVYRARLMGYIKVIILILPLMFMLSVFIAIKFQKYFSGPILRLVQVIKRVSSTHDYSQKLVFDETNEIGELYRGFNLLLEQVDFNTQRLQAVRNELENSNLELNKLNYVLQDH